LDVLSDVVRYGKSSSSVVWYRPVYSVERENVDVWDKDIWIDANKFHVSHCIFSIVEIEALVSDSNKLYPVLYFEIAQ
jgi:hypothetical protein